MKEEEKRAIALSMTQTYFMIMPEKLKEEYSKNPNGYDDLFISKYNQSLNKVNLIDRMNREEVMRSFGSDDNSLNSSILK